MSDENKEDMMALASLAALGLAIFLGFVKKMNTGLLRLERLASAGRLSPAHEKERGTQAVMSKSCERQEKNTPSISR